MLVLVRACFVPVKGQLLVWWGKRACLFFLLLLHSNNIKGLLYLQQAGDWGMLVFLLFLHCHSLYISLSLLIYKMFCPFWRQNFL